MNSGQIREVSVSPLQKGSVVDRTASSDNKIIIPKGEEISLGSIEKLYCKYCRFVQKDGENEIDIQAIFRMDPRPSNRRHIALVFPGDSKESYIDTNDGNLVISALGTAKSVVERDVEDRLKIGESIQINTSLEGNFSRDDLTKLDKSYMYRVIYRGTERTLIFTGQLKDIFDFKIVFTSPSAYLINLSFNETASINIKRIGAVKNTK